MYKLHDELIKNEAYSHNGMLFNDLKRNESNT
jgi:hypothetical protein